MIADGVGRRLENFFWRIWSSTKILHQIRGRQVAVQFSHISEGGYFRTTPTQSPRLSRVLGENETGTPATPKAPASPPDASPPNDPPSGLADQNQVVTRARRMPVHRAEPASSVTSKAAKPLPSILKKPKTAAAAPSSPALKVFSPDSGFSQTAGGDDDRGELLPAVAPSAAVSDESFPPGRPSSSTEVHDFIEMGGDRGSRRSMMSRDRAKTTEKSSGLQEDVKPKFAGKRTVLAKTGARKRRPTMVQRKSSQSSSSTASVVARSPTSRIKAGSAAGAHVETPNVDQSIHAEDQPLMQDIRHGRAHPPRRHSAAMEDECVGWKSRGQSRREAPGPADGLVDRDFRSRFAARSRVDNPLLAPFTEQSMAAAAATSTDHQATGITDSAPSQSSKHKGTWNEDFTDEIIPLKPPGSSGPGAKDDEAQALPRSKSQLTLLLEQDRQRRQERKQGKDAH